MSALGLLLRIVFVTIVTSSSLWIAGRMIVGADKAKFSDAFWIVALGIVVESLVRSFVTGFIAPLVQLVVWLYLVRHYFDTGWGSALFISILASVVFILATIGLAVLLSVLGLTFLSAPSPTPFIF
ncbi:MAG: hypothetical protein JSV27_11150 [Candidatus Bathyarchaeota archaeon]|nr:MAG: hypothetical protein JSV27_11150 [Candidatus Bathyarchaeota archaeon]